MRALVLALVLGCFGSAVSAQPPAARSHGSAADLEAIKLLVSDATAGWDAFDVERATVCLLRQASVPGRRGRFRSRRLSSSPPLSRGCIRFRKRRKDDAGWRTSAFIVSDERSGGALPPQVQPVRR
jgi:hypothetical protein